MTDLRRRNNQSGQPDQSLLPDLFLPLHRVWATSLNAHAVIQTTPFVRGQRVVARCGDTVAGLRLGDGALQWARRVGLDDSDAQRCAASQAFVISALRGPAGHALIALAWVDGAEIWSTPLSGTVIEDGIAISDNAVYALTANDDASRVELHEIRTDSGDTHSIADLPTRVRRVIVDAARVFVVSDAEDDTAGLYLVDWQREEAVRVLMGRLTAACSGRDVLFLTRHDTATAASWIVAVARADFGVLWSESISTDMLAADAGQVVHLEATTDDRLRCVLRDEQSGTVIWRSNVMPDGITGIFLSGDAVCLQEAGGITFLHRSDGTWWSHLASEGVPFSHGAAVLPGRLLLGHGGDVCCYASEL